MLGTICNEFTYSRSSSFDKIESESADFNDNGMEANNNDLSAFEEDKPLQSTITLDSSHTTGNS